jgi:hypothetical protein
MCNAPATTVEHVPPQCIFPKDAHYRKQLITVPSCHEHNLSKSMSDEYVKFLFTTVEGTNELARSNLGSVMRSFEHRPHLFYKFTPNLRLVWLRGHETVEFSLDWTGFIHCISSIVRGLYFHEYRQKLLPPISVVPWGNDSIKTNLETIRKAESQLPSNYRGANPKVFQYAFNKSMTGKTWICQLRFYEGHPISISWKSLSVPENNTAL